MEKIKIFIIVIIICLINTFINKNIDYNFIFIIFLIAFIYIKLYYKKTIEDVYRQVEILIPLFNELEIKNKLPMTRGYAAAPDFLYLIKDIIKKNKPKLILEAGSGISTIIASYALQKYSNGKIITLDHEKKYLELTHNEIVNNNLANYSTIIHAPLKKYKDGNIWYDIEKLGNISDIDFFIIDGPPVSFSKNIRYLAIPLLLDKIKKGAIIILDDCKRKEEKNVISLWKKEFDCFDFKYIDNSKGAYIITKIK